jgi:hypothetical protein
MPSSVSATQDIIVNAQTIKFQAITAALTAADKLLPKSFPRRDPASLIRAAAAAASAGAQEGLTRLLAAIAADTDLTMFGRLSLRWDIIRLLRNAQLVEDRLAQTPAIAAAPITAPIFILGLPRSGTTFLHALLARDPANLVPRNWQTIYPAPRPPNFDPARDNHAKTVEAQLKFFAALAPGFAEHHPTDADSPQECSEITACVFQSLRFDTTFRVPGYLAWMDRHGHDEAFAFHRKFLQFLQAGLPATRWVLKCPDHTFSLDSILKTYPDARFIVVHRDPVAVFGSVAHLTEILRKPFVKNIDPAEIGAQVTERWIDGAARLVAFDQRPEIPASRKLHIQYDDLVADPLAAVARVYAHFAEPLSRQAEAAMAASLAEKPRGGYTGQRQYALHKFGISPDALAPRFAQYLDYFGVLPS